MQRGITLLIIFFTILVTASTKFGIFASSNEEVIPSEAIRLRIIANSNDEIDQEIKLEIKDAVVAYIHPKVSDVDEYGDARKEIYNHVDEISMVVNKVLEENNIETNYYVDYGLTNFPTKAYGDTVYKAGKYEAVYIVLGEGKGDNWWCVLFPPLCLVDVTIDNEDVVENKDEIEYSFYFVDKIKQLFSNN